MRQMPSVTVTTVPWLPTSDAGERFWILLRIRSLISDGFSCCIVAPGGFSFPSSLEEGCRRSRRGGIPSRRTTPALRATPPCPRRGLQIDESQSCVQLFSAAAMSSSLPRTDQSITSSPPPPPPPPPHPP